MNLEKTGTNPRLLWAATSLARSELEQLLFVFEQAWLAAQRRSLTWRGPRHLRALGAGNKGKLCRLRAKLLFYPDVFQALPVAGSHGTLVWDSSVGSQPVDSSAHTGFGKGLGATNGVAGAPPGGFATGAGRMSELGICVGWGGASGAPPQGQRPAKAPRQQEKAAPWPQEPGRHQRRQSPGLEPDGARQRGTTKLADQTRWCWPRGGTVLRDTGFTGYTPARTDVLRPRRKPRGQSLDAVWKTINRAISRLRVGVKHALAGVKRCHIVADFYRNTQAGFEDAVMLSACGLHHFRVSCRSAA